MVSGLVYLVEDDDAVRDALSLVLRTAGHEVRAFASAEDLLEGLAPSDRPEVCVVDVRLPKLSGLELQQRLVAEETGIPIILITGHGDVAMATQALKAGALDFIQKPVDRKVLLAGIEQGLEHACRTRRSAARIKIIADRMNSLTSREHEVMDLVVAGASNKIIANHLGISPRTVEVYRRRVMEKMRAKTLPDLVRLVEAAASSAEQEDVLENGGEKLDHGSGGVGPLRAAQ